MECVVDGKEIDIDEMWKNLAEKEIDTIKKEIAKNSKDFSMAEAIHYIFDYVKNYDTDLILWHPDKCSVWMDSEQDFKDEVADYMRKKPCSFSEAISDLSPHFYSDRAGIIAFIVDGNNLNCTVIPEMPSCFLEDLTDVLSGNIDEKRLLDIVNYLKEKGVDVNHIQNKSKEKDYEVCR